MKSINRKKTSTRTKSSNKSKASDTSKPSEGEYTLRNFYGVFRKVFDGSLPFEDLIGHVTYVDRGHRICVRHAPKQHEEDVFQELSLKVYLHIHTLHWVEDEEQFFFWAAKVARNISNDMRRKKRRLGAIDDAPVEDHIISDETTPSPYLECATQEWIDSLPPLRRQILQICIETGEVSTRKIAQLLARQGITRSHAAIAKYLKESLKSYLEILEKVGKQKRSHGKGGRRTGGLSRRGGLGHERKKTQQH